MGLDLNRIRGKQKEAEAKSTGGFFKPKVGRNTIRVFSFDHKVTKEDVADGLFTKEKLGKTVTELDRAVVRLFNVEGIRGPVLVTSNDCPAMKAHNKFVAKCKDSDEIRKRRPQTAYFINVCDTSEKDLRVVEYACNKTVYEQILGKILDPDYGESILGTAGRDIVIMYDDNKQGSAMYSVEMRKEGKSEELPDSLEKQVKDFYDHDVFIKLGTVVGGESGDVDDEGADESDDDEDSDEEESEKSDESEESEESEDDSEDDESDDDEELPDDEDDEDEKPKTITGTKPIKKGAVTKKGPLAKKK
jgi:hypothetical protein